MFELFTGLGKGIKNIVNRVLDRRSQAERAVLATEEMYVLLNSQLANRTNNKLKQQEYPSVNDTLNLGALENRGYVPPSIKAGPLKDEMLDHRVIPEVTPNQEAINPIQFAQTQLSTPSSADPKRTDAGSPNAEPTTALSLSEAQRKKAREQQEANEFLSNPSEEKYLELSSGAKRIVSLHESFDSNDIIKILEHISTNPDIQWSEEVAHLLSSEHMELANIIASEEMLEIYRKLIKQEKFREKIYHYLFTNILVYELQFKKIFDLLKSEDLLEDFGNYAETRLFSHTQKDRIQVLIENLQSPQIEVIQQENEPVMSPVDLQQPQKTSKIENQEENKKLAKIVGEFDAYLRESLDPEMLKLDPETLKKEYRPLQIKNPNQPVFYNFTLILAEINNYIGQELKAGGKYEFDEKKLFLALGNSDHIEFVRRLFQFLKDVKKLIPQQSHFGILGTDLDAEEKRCITKLQESDKAYTARLNDINVDEVTDEKKRTKTPTSPETQRQNKLHQLTENFEKYLLNNTVIPLNSSILSKLKITNTFEENLVEVIDALEKFLECDIDLSEGIKPNKGSWFSLLKPETDEVSFVKELLRFIESILKLAPEGSDFLFPQPEIDQFKKNTLAIQENDLDIENKIDEKNDEIRSRAIDDGLSLDDLFNIEADDVFRFVRSWKINMHKLLNMEGGKPVDESKDDSDSASEANNELDLSLLDEESGLFEINRELSRDSLGILTMLRNDTFKSKDVGRQSELVTTGLSAIALDLIEGLRKGEKLTQETIDELKERLYAIPEKFRNANLDIVWMISNLQPNMSLKDLNIDKKFEIKLGKDSKSLFSIRPLESTFVENKPEVPEVSSEIKKPEAEEDFLAGAKIEFEFEENKQKPDSASKSIVPVRPIQSASPQGRTPKITVENPETPAKKTVDEDIMDAEFEVIKE